jgi:superfamily I DNA/RNA helicase
MTLLMRALSEDGIFGGAGDPAQAIMMFAGAEPDSFDQLKDHFDADELPLSICYRCPTSVIAEAQKIVPEIEARPDAPEGLVATIGHNNFLEMLERGDMVICRSTAPLMKLCFELIGRNVPATVRGRDIGAKMSNTIKTIQKRNYDVKAFPRLAAEWLETSLEVLRAKLGTEAQQDSVRDQYEALTICYKNVQPFSVQGFCDKIYGMFSDGASPITLSTIHKAKGLEFPRVFIIQPEKLPLIWKNQSPDQFKQEMNLKYVAITRAKRELYFVESAAPAPGLFEDDNE